MESPFLFLTLFSITFLYYIISFFFICRGHRSRNRMVVGFTITCSTKAVLHQRCEFVSRSWRGVFYATLCEKVSVTCDRSVVFSTNKTDHHDITEILLKVAVTTITLSPLMYVFASIFIQFYMTTAAYMSRPSIHLLSTKIGLVLWCLTPL